jgi:hypothetical protein
VLNLFAPTVVMVVRTPDGQDAWIPLAELVCVID